VEGGSHCRCVCYTERRQTKREGREVAIADVFAVKRGQGGANSKNNTKRVYHSICSVPIGLIFYRERALQQLRMKRKRKGER
jgi:hypothetical protein